MHYSFKISILSSLFSFITLTCVTAFLFPSDRYWLCFIISAFILSLFSLIELVIINTHINEENGELLRPLRTRPTNLL